MPAASSGPCSLPAMSRAAEARADPLRRLGEAGERGRAARAGRDRRCARRRRQPRAGRLRGDRCGGMSERAVNGRDLPSRRCRRWRWSSSTAGAWPMPGPGNAIDLAEHADLRRALGQRYPHTSLSASGRDVGLPDGQMGNSEVGHLNLGAGAIVKQDLGADRRLDRGRLVLRERGAARRLRGARARARAGRLHLIGLVSDGGVHSGWEHIEACIELAAREGVPDLVAARVHRRPRHLPNRRRRPTSRRSSAGCGSAGRIGTVGGRYYGMDRDRRWERTKLAFDAIVHARGARGRRRGRGGQSVASSAGRPTSSSSRP